MKRPLVALSLLLSISACGPKGSNKPATLDKGSTGRFIIRHPNFEGHLDADVEHEGSKWTLKLTYSGFPEKSAITLEGKTLPLERTGDIPTNIDLTSAIGDAPVTTLTGATPLSVNIPFELTFWNKRQKVSGAFTQVNASMELRRCLITPPCPFAGDGPANAKPNVMVAIKNDFLSSNIVGSPSKMRDIDWIAIVIEGDPVDGKRCKMERLSGIAAGVTDEHTLKRETLKITVNDRRTGALLKTRDLLADDRCPMFGTITTGGDKPGLRSTLTDADRNRAIAELRGDAPAGGSSSSASSPSARPSGPAPKTKPKIHGKK